MPGGLLHFKIQYLFREINASMSSDPAGEHTLRIIAQADKFNHWIYKTIQPHLKGSILEIGSGIGNISQYLVRDGFSITLSDYNPDYCRYLEQRFGRHPNVKAIVTIDLQDADFYKKYETLKEQFDTIYLLNVVEHLADDSKAVAYCRYLLKNAGTLIILVPAFQFLYCRLDKNLGHFRRYTTKQLKTLLHDGFKITHNQYINAVGVAGWLLYGKVLQNPLLQQQEMQAYNKLVPLAKFIDPFFNRLFGLSVMVTAQKN